MAKLGSHKKICKQINLIPKRHFKKCKGIGYVSALFDRLTGAIHRKRFRSSDEVRAGWMESREGFGGWA